MGKYVKKLMKDNRSSKRINNIFDNPMLLKELLENSVGVRKANDFEIQELNKRISNNKKIALFIILMFFGYFLFLA